MALTVAQELTRLERLELRRAARLLSRSESTIKQERQRSDYLPQCPVCGAYHSARRRGKRIRRQRVFSLRRTG